MGTLKILSLIERCVSKLIDCIAIAACITIFLLTMYYVEISSVNIIK